MKKRKKGKISFIVLGLMFIIGSSVHAQNAGWRAGYPSVQWAFRFEAPVSHLAIPSFAKSMGISSPVKKQEYVHISAAVMPSADYYAQNMGYMCKREWQFEKAAHIPLRIRLGSLDECNFLEGKTQSQPK